MINKKYKDRLFRKIFSDEKNKGNLLELYNELNGTTYSNLEDLEITTIDDVIYMGMKNDVSFLLDSTMSLYEQQSTFNPNMPLRGFMYFSKLYNKYISTRHLNIFSNHLVKIPMPQYYVFYNGRQEFPDRMELKLSHAFQIKKGEGFEWTAVMININYGRNKKLMNRCKILRDYAILVDKIRKYQKENVDMEAVVSRAVNECIAGDVLAEFLLAHKAEVIEMCLTEYNEEETMAMLREEYKEEGLREGREQGLKEGRQKGRQEGRKLGHEEALIDLMKDGILSKEQVAGRLNISLKQLEEKIKE